jgi:hypothetical protein
VALFQILVQQPATVLETFHGVSVKNRAYQPKASVPKTARRKIAMAGGIHFVPIFFYFFCPTSVSIL